MKKIFVKADEDLYLIVARYDNNNRLYIGFGNEDEIIYGDITINLPEVSIDKNEIFLSDDLSEDAIDILKGKKIIEEVGNSIQYNMGRYNKAVVNFDVLKEYDPTGMEEFLENYNKCEDMER